MLYAIAMGQITRLPSNLRSTTRECVHLVTRGHFRSHDKDGGHTIRSAIAKLHGSMFYTTAVMGDGSFTLQEQGFSTFLLL